MSVPYWAAELAQAFWAKATEVEPFPRKLRQPIARALQLTVVLLPKLSVQAALDWLHRCGIVCEMAGADRPLRGCLVACYGHGFILVDGADDDAELRFTVAHELAHFLRDYWDPRRRLDHRLGKTALEVLDGRRPPTAQERLQALLRDIPLGFHVHLMERNSDGQPATAAIASAERDADRLAFELLAPAEHVLGAAGTALEQKLRDVYGLPALQAAQYAAILAPPVRSDPFLLRLKSMA